MKRLKERRRRVSTTQQFCVIARDSDCLEAILHAAMGQKLRVFTKGHTQHRLYIECSEKIWNRFRPQIQDYIIDESPVQCPSWIRKHIRANLQAAVANRLSPPLAKRASEILAAANAASKANNERLQKALQPKPLIDTAQSPQPVPSGRKRTIRSRVNNLLRKTRNILNIFKFNKSRRPVHS